MTQLMINKLIIQTLNVFIRNTKKGSLATRLL